MKIFVRCAGVRETEEGVTVTLRRSVNNAEIQNGADVELDAAFTLNFTGDARSLGKTYSVGLDYSLDLGGAADIKADLTAPVPLDAAALNALSVERGKIAAANVAVT